MFSGRALCKKQFLAIAFWMTLSIKKKKKTALRRNGMHHVSHVNREENV